MRIALDAMGSDNHPVPDVGGAVLAAKEFGDTIYLVGDEPRLKQELAKHDTTNLKLIIKHASQVITMDDKPSTVGRIKPDSSMHVGMTLVRDGHADGFVTAGNTGAALSIALLYTLKRIRGVRRPALSAIVRFRGHDMIILDVGANADSKAEWVAQFALMGKIYANQALGLQSPRVALLSNGEEEGKGNQLVHDTAALLRNANLNFIGNIEPKDMLTGEIDVIVADGFVGNIFIKTLEGATELMGRVLRDELMRDVVSKMGALLSRPAYRRVRKQFDPFEIGGAPLLGVNGVVIIGHGRSNANAIKNAIRQARLAVQGNLIEAIRQGVSDTKVGISDQPEDSERR